MGKRGNGEGTIYRRADGAWAAQITVGYENGRAKRKSFSGKTRKEVHAKLVKAQRARQQGTPVTSVRVTVEQYLSRWIEETVKAALEPSTYRTYRGYIRNRLIPALGNHQLERLTPQHVQAMLSNLEKEGLAPRSILQIRNILRKALNDAMKTEDIARFVARLVTPPKVQRYDISPLTPEEARALLAAARDEPLESLYVVAMATGLRQGELLGLTWECVDLDAGILTIRQQLQRVDGSLRLKGLKSRSSRRTLSLPDIAVAALHRQQGRQREQLRFACSRWKGNRLNLVFTTTIGTPLDGAGVTRRFQQFLARAGLRRQRFHDLRHGAATLLLAQGEDLRTIMDYLGHSTITLTANTYAHLTPAMRRKAAASMDAALTDPK